VNRGGSFNNNNNLRTANRNNNNPDNRNNNIGFRCAAPPISFLKGQVRAVHGRRAVAASEGDRPVPGWVRQPELAAQPKMKPLRLVQ